MLKEQIKLTVLKHQLKHGNYIKYLN